MGCQGYQFFYLFFKDPVMEKLKLARFLEVEENMELFNDIADKCDFKNLKKAAESKQSFYQLRDDHQFIYRKGNSNNERDII